jgi:hypothetical protein
MTNISSNPFHSSISSIVITGAGEAISLMDKDNVYGDFHRLEMTSSINEAFPAGTLIVRDKGDLISKINGGSDQKYVTLTTEDGSSASFRIHSASHANNAAAQTEEPYVIIHFSNDFYNYCQENTLTDIWPYYKPTVYRIDKFIEQTLTEAGYELSEDFSNQTNNYVCFRPFNPKIDGTEIPSDNIAEYFNYLASYAIPYPGDPGVNSYLNKPRFFFWSEWYGPLNFKCITDVDDPKLISRMNSNNFKYAIYSDDASARRIGGQLYNKIYSYSTNQGLQYITNGYYYVRKTPKILDDYSVTTDKEKYTNLAYQFLDEGSKFNIEIVGTKGTNNDIVPGSEQLDPGKFGYPDETISNSRDARSSLLSREYGYSKSYNNIRIDGTKGYMEFVDSPEMWKNVFDLTPLDPFHPEQRNPAVAIPDQSNLQKVLNIKFNSQYDNIEGSDTNSKLELIRKIELQNFVLYSLCCMGNPLESGEETFFAKLTGVSSTPIDVYDGNNTKRKFLYTFKKLKFVPKKNTISDPDGSNFDFKSIYCMHSNTAGWTFDNSENPNGEAAINLNEIENDGPLTSNSSFISPGWFYTTPAQVNIKYRPIGTNNASGSDFDEIKHIVKMHKKPILKLLREGGYTGSVKEEYLERVLYYFDAQNILDGACPAPQ